MIKVACVRFKSAGRIYYFDPAGLELHGGDNVIVETVRGIEFGTLSSDLIEVDESSIVSPLKPIIRIATADDERRNRENEAKKDRALAICQEKIENRGLDMKLVDVEYTFDNSKIIYYFTAEGRVDFRELVKDLAGVFRMRIELRQIGVRDETKMMGGIGCCGRDLCCHSWLPEFGPVSIKMAKVQNLSLNPIKISGICGRLMCCLQYENDNYIESRKGMPEVGERITTRDGRALVCDINILNDKIKTRLILEERDGDKPEKLSTEYYTYSKEEITRQEKHKPERKEDAKNKPAKKKGRGRKPGENLADEEIAFLSEEELAERLSESEDEPQDR
ncbi:MAG: stage 0 sporulation family protein [Firmicutes bacterium]|nr:stage 0 sporulation family protein [Bacillota bacterium]MBQ5437120.1 stage 0 sporulation family protein [Bacillota bacterium]MBR0522072.1 stage 0 sporulation family protein [Bacillota bacterium]